MLILAYLAAIVAANLSVTHFGPSAAILNSFLFIGLDLTCRDRLHELWRGRQLWPRMAALIAAGSLISYALNRDAGPIAVASFVAFASAGVADAFVYHLLRRQDWLIRANGSNLVSAAIDSAVFPTIAFRQLLPLVIFGQFLAKTLGGAGWALILNRRIAQEIHP